MSSYHVEHGIPPQEYMWMRVGNMEFNPTNICGWGYGGMVFQFTERWGGGGQRDIINSPLLPIWKWQYSRRIEGREEGRWWGPVGDLPRNCRCGVLLPIPLRWLATLILPPQGPMAGPTATPSSGGPVAGCCLAAPSSGGPVAGHPDAPSSGDPVAGHPDALYSGPYGWPPYYSS